MSNEILPDVEPPQMQKKQNRAFVIIVIALIALFVLSCGGIVAYVVLGGIRYPSTEEILTESHLKGQCRDWNLDLSVEECAAWVRGLKQDHAEDYRDCVGDPNDGRLEFEDVYDCFVSKGLAPQK